MSKESFVTIVRGPAPAYKNRIPILLDEIRALAIKRSDIAIEVFEGKTPSGRYVLVSGLPRGDGTPVLELRNGFLAVENPDQDTLAWMLDIAGDLDARVRSGLRTYRTPTEKYVHPDDVEARKKLAKRLRIVRNKWIPFEATIIKYAIMAFFLILGLIGFWIGKQFEHH